MNLYQKISAVMKDIQYLTKDDTVDAGKGKSYRAITEEKVTTAVRASMIQHGLTMLPIAMTTHREDEVVESQYGNKINRITTVEVTYRITDIDKPDDYIDIVSAGTGVDTQDKGIGKALTYCYKYALLRSYAIPTGDDPDKISSDVYTEMLTGGKPRQSKEDFALREMNIAIVKSLFEKNGKTESDAKAWLEKTFGVPYENITAQMAADAKVKLARYNNA